MRPRLTSMDHAQQNNAFQPYRSYDSVAVGGLRGLRSFPSVKIERFDVVAFLSVFQPSGRKLRSFIMGNRSQESIV